MMPYGRKPPRENALCPNCLSLERHRLIWLYLRDRTEFFSIPMKFLHIAPEICFINRFEKLSNIEYITGDIESPLAKVKMDIMNIPFGENTFDAVMCNHVMEHIEDDINAMKEVYRVLKPGGWDIMQVPFMGMNLETSFEDPDVLSPSDRLRVFGQEDHVRIYGKDYGRRLEKGGFKVTEDDYVMKMPSDLVHKYALAPDEIIYFCKK